jgi:Holliday junction DNA helicase RuvA
VLSFLQGTLKECYPEYVVVEIMGIGFHILIPASFYFQLPLPGNTVTIYTHLFVREDGFFIYGFRSNEERDFFKMLLGVTGIGPKVALAALGHLSPNQISAAIADEDLPALTGVPGIGSKTAKRLIYELKDKVNAQRKKDNALPGGEGINPVEWRDVQQALTALGYSAGEVERAKKALIAEEAEGVEVLFKKALAFLAHR